MPTTQIVYDTTSGRIVGIHHFLGASDAEESTRRRLAQFESVDVSEGDLGVVGLSDYSVDPKKFYKVEVGSRTLSEVPEGEGGVSFGFEASQPPPGRKA